MRKEWLLCAIGAGIAAAVVAFFIISLINVVYRGHSEMMDQLSIDGTLGNIKTDEYMVTNGPFFLGAIAMLLLELLTGAVSVLFARSAGGSNVKFHTASIIAGLLPALLWGIIRLNDWISSASQYGSHSSVRPHEPALPGIALGLLLFEVALCLLASLAGGCLVQLATDLRANGGS